MRNRKEINTGKWIIIKVDTAAIASILECKLLTCAFRKPDSQTFPGRCAFYPIDLPPRPMLNEIPIGRGMKDRGLPME